MVVVSNSGAERDCRKAVRELGFSCYMPTFREQIVTKGRKVWEERLLFGRYFFARWPDHSASPKERDADWRQITTLRLVTGLFMQVLPANDPNPFAFATGNMDIGKPALVRDNEIEAIRAREDRSGHVTSAARREFIEGQKVRATRGLWQGTDAVYVAPGRAGCDIAALPMFGCVTNVEFAPGVLQAA